MFMVTFYQPSYWSKCHYMGDIVTVTFYTELHVHHGLNNKLSTLQNTQHKNGVAHVHCLRLRAE